MKQSFLKPLIAATLLTTGIATAYAGNISNISNIPPTASGFGISLTGLYLQPNASNLEYAVYTSPLPGPAPTWKTINLDPSYQPGFDIGLQYTFSTRADQIKLDWLHLYTSDTDSASASGHTSIAPSYYFGPFAQALFNSNAKNKTKFYVDNANFVYDHLFNLNRYVQLEPFAGIGSAYLKQDLTTTFRGQNATGDAYEHIVENTSKYLGIGPRIGLTTSVFVARHFGIFAELAAAALVGSMQSKTDFTSQGRDNPTAVSTTMADQRVNRVVPEFDSKLGLSYTFMFNSGSSFVIQAGYMFTTFINGINQVVPTALVPDTFDNGVIAIETSDEKQSNLDLNGPFIKLAWRF